ncbi:hypothetical protein GCM10027566_00050 [Arachidicoccus ginsenosidivorans]|uniref:T9SS type A sorting domain-containing protein n=1 Tax=Arachidicoccus ginsenosidivorans TaxID=496057 RepID=A0A5B8VQ77_9BACT|nr:T9SS type A sorting domain-containing protein [Arachidicoccus ginsenosidivorans]QEC73787.1 T9SS type A sorting domain-containing protein [Arachidicoccus ginsenosidivorans]
MEPGSGYMLYRTTDDQTSFHYGALGGSLGLSRVQNQNLHLSRLNGNRRLLNTNQLRLAANFKYAENMTILAAVDSSTKIQSGDIVLAYVGGELRAKAGAYTLPAGAGKGAQPVFLFNIAGNSPDPVIFKLQRQGRVIASSPAVFNYAVNGQLGSIGQPYVLHFGTDGKQKVTLFPNPFKNEVQLTIDLASSQLSHSIQYSVFDIGGRLVYKSPNAQVTGLSYHTSWKPGTGSGSRLDKHIAPGVYLIQVTIDGHSETYKVIKR